MEYCYDLIISDLRFRICSSFPVHLPEYFRPFLAAEVFSVKSDFTIWVYTDDNYPYDIHETDSVQTYYWEHGKSIMRVEPHSEQDTIYLIIPKAFLERFSQKANWLLYLALERSLLKRECVVLHASAVMYEGQAYLFTAPSSGGKSTQARLWEEHFHAVLINGDKVILHNDGTQLIAYGSPIAGSSGIYRNLSAPVAAIAHLEKASCNRVSDVSKRDAFLLLYSEAVKSNWDSMFNQRLMSVLESYPMNTRIVKLQCVPDASAADCLINFIKKERDQST